LAKRQVIFSKTCTSSLARQDPNPILSPHNKYTQKEGLPVPAINRQNFIKPLTATRQLRRIYKGHSELPKTFLLYRQIFNYRERLL